MGERSPDPGAKQAGLPARLLALATGPTGIGRLLRFAVVGASGVLVDMPIFWALVHLARVYDLLAVLPAYAAATVWNFALNDLWTFRDRRDETGSPTPVRFAKYALVSLLPLAYRLATYWPLTRVSGQTKLAAYAIAIVVGMVWNFGVNFLWTWRKRSRQGAAEG